ncbi:MAG: TIGR02710 family CRISPR-associated protein [Magnetococcales bacterium]|nr:TIGR02710 family CRISPR-associated protein [Magnetococcales bacterium]
MAKAGKSGVLLLTVGTGDENRREETLYTPLRLSIQDGRWSRVILLPSQVTGEWADAVKGALHAYPVEVYPLPAAGDEDDADRCFDHFDRVLTGLKEQGEESGFMAVDPTRGTKMMSAALTLAAVRHDIPHLRYITGERDQRGMVTSGSERIARFKTTRIMASHRLEDACRLFEHGNFAAVMELLPDPNHPLTRLNWPEEFHVQLSAIRALASFYEAWDRLSYRAAHAVPLSEPESLASEWRRFYPAPVVRAWVEHLAMTFPEGDDLETRRQKKAPYLRRLMVDLWANGWRRLQQKQLEDAVVRAYRVLEMAGQMALFLHGHDSSCLDPADATIRSYLDYMKGKKDTPLSANRDGTLMAGRERVTGLLKMLKDPLARTLSDLGNLPMMSARVRNGSVLIHGFQARAPDEGTMRDFYRRLESEVLLPGCAPYGTEWLALARTPEFLA